MTSSWLFFIHVTSCIVARCALSTTNDSVVYVYCMCYLFSDVCFAHIGVYSYDSRQVLNINVMGGSSPAFPPYPRPLFSLFYSCTPAQNSEFAPAPAPLTPTPAHFWSKSSIPRPPNPRATDPLSSPTNMDTELSDGFISTRQTIWVVRNMNHTSQWIYSQMPPNMKSFPPYVSPFSCLSVDLNCGHFYCHLPT